MSKANRMLGLLRYTFVRIDVAMLTQLSKTFVRSLLEFAVPVWYPHFLREIRMLESVQHRATRIVYELRCRAGPFLFYKPRKGRKVEK